MDLTKLKIGEQAPEEVNVVVEIPQGSAVKYELDAETGKLEVDRTIGSAEVYPYHYGFIPETLSGDGDALDAMVISGQPAKSKDVVVCRPVAVLKMQDEVGQDEKILAVPIDETNPAYSQINDLSDLGLPLQEKIKLFFAQYKEMEKTRWSKVSDFGDKAQAIETIKAGIARAGRPD